MLAVCSLIFICGLAAGAAGTHFLLHHNTPVAVRREPSLQLLKDSLQLSREQQRVVMQVLDDYAKYYENLEDDRRSVAEHGKRQILEVLTPEQQKRFLQMFGSPWTPPHEVNTSTN